MPNGQQQPPKPKLGHLSRFQFRSFSGPLLSTGPSVDLDAKRRKRKKQKEKERLAASVDASPSQQDTRRILTAKSLSYTERKQNFVENIRPKTAYSSKQDLTDESRTKQSTYKTNLPTLQLSTSAVSFDDRYYGEASQTLFYDTYRQLNSRGNIMLDGFNELEQVIQQSETDNVFAKSVHELESYGVLTPPITSRERPATHSTKIQTFYDEDNENFSNFVTQRPHTAQEARRAGQKQSAAITRPVSDTNLNSKADYEELARLNVDDDNQLLQHADGNSVWSSIFEDTSQELLPLGNLNLNERRADSGVVTNYTNLYTPSSPRAVYLTGCLKQRLPPLRSAMLRRANISGINLAHMSVGDKLATVLAQSINDMPHLSTVNLMGNNLRSAGLVPIINAIVERDDIQALDLSLNHVDLDTASALMTYMGNTRCQLKTLKLSGCAVDDSVCVTFVKQLLQNQQLTELDLSRNLIGKEETRNTVHPNFVTGAEALADLLLFGSCPLTKLDLQWNMIRLDSAVTLCNSIRQHRTLTTLDLSYNGLGRNAADILGSAVMENNVLKHLNIANNGIDGIGAFTLFVGVRENNSLLSLNMDGNPVGDLGGRMLVELAVHVGHRMQLSAKNCDFQIKTSDVKFSFSAPCKTYELDLCIPYERAILFQLLVMCAIDPAKSVHYFGFNPRPKRAVSANKNTKQQKVAAAAAAADATAGNDVKYQTIAILLYDEILPESALTPTELDEKAELQQIIRILQLTKKDIMKLTADYDPDGIDMFPTSRLKDVLGLTGVTYNETRVSEVRFALDPHDRGLIDAHALATFLVKRGHIAQERLDTLIMRRWIALASAPQQRYVPPKQGCVKIQVMEKIVLDGGHRPLSQTKCKHVIDIAECCSNPLPLLYYGLDAYTIYFEEAKLMFNTIMKRSDDAVFTLCKILPKLLLSSDALLLMQCCIGNNTSQLKRLKQKLGKAYHPYLGVYSNFYHLDLSNEIDRVCLKMLIEKSIKNELARKETGQWDTSQNGNWNCFRNEYHYPVANPIVNGVEVKPTPVKNSNGEIIEEEKTLSPKYYYPIPNRGKLEFDFINIERPQILFDEKAIDDAKLIDILFASRLLPNTDHSLNYCLKRLNELSIAHRKLVLSSGYSYWKTEYARGDQVGDLLYNMYSNLHERKNSLLKSSKREMSRNDLDGKHGASKFQLKKLQKNHHKADDDYKTVVIDYHSEPNANSSVNAHAYTTLMSTKTSDTSPLAAHTSNHTTTGTLSTSDITEEHVSVLERMQQLVPFRTKQSLSVKSSARNLRAENHHSDFPPLKFYYKPNQLYAWDVGKTTWLRKLYEISVDVRLTDEYKSAVLLDYFETVLINYYFYCKHISLLLEVFKTGSCTKSILGSYRIELVVLLFDRIIDIQNFEFILTVLNSEEQAALYARIGILNVFNPCKPEGMWKLDLLRWDERQVAKMLIHLGVAELGENWSTKAFQYDHGFHSIAGWELTTVWLSEDGLPKKGIVSIEFNGGDSMHLTGCSANRVTRMMLTALVLVNQIDFQHEIQDNNMQLSKEKHRLVTFNSKTRHIKLNTARIWPVLPLMKLITQSHLLGALNQKAFQFDVITVNNQNRPQARTKSPTNARKRANFQHHLGNLDSIVTYTYEDCNKLLRLETDIKWDYTSTNKTSDVW